MAARRGHPDQPPLHSAPAHAAPAPCSHQAQVPRLRQPYCTLVVLSPGVGTPSVRHQQAPWRHQQAPWAEPADRSVARHCGQGQEECPHPCQPRGPTQLGHGPMDSCNRKQSKVQRPFHSTTAHDIGRRAPSPLSRAQELKSCLMCMPGAPCTSPPPSAPAVT